MDAELLATDGLRLHSSQSFFGSRNKDSFLIGVTEGKLPCMFLDLLGSSWLPAGFKGMFAAAWIPGSTSRFCEKV